MEGAFCRHWVSRHCINQLRETEGRCVITVLLAIYIKCMPTDRIKMPTGKIVAWPLNRSVPADDILLFSARIGSVAEKLTDLVGKLLTVQ